MLVDACRGGLPQAVYVTHVYYRRTRELRYSRACSCSQPVACLFMRRGVVGSDLEGRTGSRTGRLSLSTDAREVRSTVHSTSSGGRTSQYTQTLFQRCLRREQTRLSSLVRPFVRAMIVFWLRSSFWSACSVTLTVLYLFKVLLTAIYSRYSKSNAEPEAVQP